MNIKDLKIKYHTTCIDNCPFTEKARLLQSIWREEQSLKMGVGPTSNSIDKKTGEPTYYGNMLLDGNLNGKNFFYLNTYDYAQKRVKEKKSKETFDEYRLFNNLLSSMPLAFNLFHPLMIIKEKYPELINQMMKNAFQNLPIVQIDEIGIEFIPMPISKYTNDKSAMDAFIKFSDEFNQKHIIAIEMKYTDHLGNNTASEKTFKNQFKIAKDLQMFTDKALEKIESKEIKLSQIYRNFLLAEKYRLVEKLKDSYSVIIAPKDHPTTKNEIESLKSNLKPEYKDKKLTNIHLEDFIISLRNSCPDDYLQWLDWFYDRYLDFEKIESIIVR